ncbi:MAG: MarR family transcriptional regulator [Alphaproteobacteria bacterium]|jgi:DNA-binding MarR family transcriptional regulator|nr:MarR family transcriptional regulator [Alphaproteobacteria bacterium]
MTADISETVMREDYALDEQIGFRLRLALQRHTAIFFSHMNVGLTQTQYAVLARLWESGESSQNELGRSAAIDSATIWGVVQRLQTADLVATKAHPSDKRRRMVSLTRLGRDTVDAAIAKAQRSNEETLAPLTVAERESLVALLGKLSD